LKVLIVNENTLVSQAMRAVLESHDFEVSLCAYTPQARGEEPGTVASGRPDVALVDIRVPDSGGIEAGRRIIRDHPLAKVLALTAQEDAGVFAAASLAGFHGWVLKTARSRNSSVRSGGSSKQDRPAASEHPASRQGAVPGRAQMRHSSPSTSPGVNGRC